MPRLNQPLNQLQVGTPNRKGQPIAPYLQAVGQLLKQQVATPPLPHEQLARTRFGQYIQSARQYHGLSRETLATQLELQVAQIYGLEEGLLPTAQIDATLLTGLAHALDEDPMLLHQLLRPAAYHHHAPPLNRQWSRWGPSLLTLLGAFYLHIASSFHAYLVQVGDSCLQCGRDCNLLNRWQPSRLTLYVITVTAAIMLSFLPAHWLAAGQRLATSWLFAEPGTLVVLPTSAKPSHNITSSNVTSNNVRGAEPVVNSLTDDGKVTATLPDRDRDPRHYQIVYAVSKPSYKNARAAYITVDEVQVAIIMLDAQVVPSPQAPCSTDGRFDLCPI